MCVYCGMAICKVRGAGRGVVSRGNGHLFVDRADAVLFLSSSGGDGGKGGEMIDWFKRCQVAC